MSKFKIGDRVACYSFHAECTGDWPLRVTGKIENIERGLLEILTQGEFGMTRGSWHPKQCRLLKKKEKSIKIWVNLKSKPGVGFGEWSYAPRRDWIAFISKK